MGSDNFLFAYLKNEDDKYEALGNIKYLSKMRVNEGDRLLV